MRIISFRYNYKLIINDLLKETCTYSAIIEAVLVFNRGQTGFPVWHIYEGVGFANFTEFERNEHLIFQKIFILFSVLSVSKVSLS